MFLDPAPPIMQPNHLRASCCCRTRNLLSLWVCKKDGGETSEVKITVFLVFNCSLMFCNLCTRRKYAHAVFVQDGNLAIFMKKIHVQPRRRPGGAPKGWDDQLWVFSEHVFHSSWTTAARHGAQCLSHEQAFRQLCSGP